MWRSRMARILQTSSATTSSRKSATARAARLKSMRNTNSALAASVKAPVSSSTRLLRSASTTSTDSLSCTSSSLSDHHALFKPWGTSKVVSHGDYRQEAWLEDHIGGPLYQFQANLPRLPVPSIEQTLQRFLPTALPLARTAEEATSLQQAVEKFPQQAAALQERLLQRADSDISSGEYANSSWLQHWWNTAGYLQVRDPVVINVSYFFHLADDPGAAAAASSSSAAEEDPQIRRAAALLYATADYRKKVCSGQLPAEQIGKQKTPLCSTAYKYMFHTTRIPALEQDSYNLYDPSQYHHVVVACRGQFYAMNFCNPTTGDAYPLAVLQQGLDQIRRMAQQEQENQQLPQLGWLTSQNRDDWATARQVLVNQGGPAMQQALEVLQSAVLMICLDDDQQPVSRQACAQLFLHAGADASAGANRWFDKSIELIVAANGKVGLLGEHAMMDGMPVVGYANRLTELTYDQAVAAESSKEKDNMAVTVSTCNVRPIFAEAFQQLDPSDLAQIHQLTAKGQNALVDLVHRHNVHVESFQGYGSDFIKRAGFSPDAFVQQAMQLATFRLWGEQAGTYEASQVRPFLHGRTETTRSVSTESAAFVQEMGLVPKQDEHVEEARKTKLRLLQAACDQHVTYIRQAAAAQGVDRHFMGLSMLVGSGNEQEKAPDLYSHPLFARSKRWRVSTSNLTHPRFVNWGYGEVVPDGVGLAYSVHPRHCVFNVTALQELGWTDKLAQLLEEALLEMRTLVEADQPPRSKL